jgi:hypothetical protein
LAILVPFPVADLQAFFCSFKSADVTRIKIAVMKNFLKAGMALMGLLLASLPGFATGFRAGSKKEISRPVSGDLYVSGLTIALIILALGAIIDSLRRKTLPGLAHAV